MKKTFAYHKPSPESLAKLAELRTAFSQLADEIERLCPERNMRDRAIESLEIASMWANKCITHHDIDATFEL